jgi:hypothetical protein
MVPKTERFVEYKENLNKVIIILKGHALIRVPCKNLKKKMTIRDYLRFIKGTKSSVDPLSIVDNNNSNMITD